MPYLTIKMAIPAIISASLSLNAMADEYFDNAPVISATPQIERVNIPRQECRQEIVRENYGVNNNASPAGAIIGGVAGGLLGSTVGKGGGKVAAAAVGAGIGALVGDRLGNNNQPAGSIDRAVDRCLMVDNWQNVSRGYLVTYRYNGRDYTTVSDDLPGSTIRVRVGVNDASRQSLASAPAQVLAPAPAVISQYNPPVYYSAPASVVYREPVRVYSTPTPVVIYGGWGGAWNNGYRHDQARGWGHERREHHRW